jgi:hypothetical protein
MIRRYRPGRAEVLTTTPGRSTLAQRWSSPDGGDVDEHVRAGAVRTRDAASVIATADAPASTADRAGQHPSGGCGSAAPLADLSARDPFDLDSDPRLCSAAAAPEPCGALCTPWCLAGHGTPSTLSNLGNPISRWNDR